MADNERRQRVISSMPHLSVDEVAARSFATKVRGYSETEVRSFLKRVADELAAAREREGELEAAIDALEDQLRAPRPLSEQELLDALGEETARLLRSAREASDDIRRKADERAARIAEEAQTAAESTRAEAAEVLATRTQQGESTAAEMLAAAEAHTAHLRATAESEIASMLEQARQAGREMLDEAKAARERILGDLVRRRALLQSQIEELRGGRDRLLDAYRTVKRTFLEATEALAQVEARAAAERSTTFEPIDVAAEIAAEIEALDAAASPAPVEPEAGEPEEVDLEAGELEGVGAEAATASIDLADAEREPAATEDDSAHRLADVDSLFARLRAGHPDDTATGSGEASAARAEPAPEAAPEAHAAEPEPDELETLMSLPAWRDRREDVLAPMLTALVKRAKRVVQDDQNALLDAVRRHKGRPTAEQVLPDVESALRDWVEVLRDAVDGAYAAGRVAAGGEPAPAFGDLARVAAEAALFPLRERVSAAIDSGEAGDTGGLVERIGARYREWKNQSLDRTLGDVLAFVWARGVYDASPDGAVLRWVTFEEGHCSDCHDNALEPTVKGKQFPTGHSFPPAHPGCRCLLAPAEVLNAPTANV